MAISTKAKTVVVQMQKLRGEGKHDVFCFSVCFAYLSYLQNFLLKFVSRFFSLKSSCRPNDILCS